MNKIIPAITFFAFFATSGAQASILNGGFETGNLTNWTASNALPAVVTSYNTDNSLTMTATEGQYFAILPGGSPVTKLTSDDFYINEGETISFDWFFDSKDYLPYNDFGSYALELVIDEIVVSANILADVQQTGNYGLTGWNTFAILATYSGDVELRFYSKNVGDNLLASVLGIDNVKVTAPVPLTASAIFMTIGLGLIGGFTTTRRSSIKTA